MWERLGRTGSVHLQPWPQYDPDALQVDEVEIVVQVNGKLRGRLMVPSGLDAEAMQKMVLADERILQHAAGKEIVKVIAVPEKLVNLVVR
jgi:leucyl-tRNA synthetase